MTVIYQDSFETYTLASAINGQGHWTAPTDLIVANDTASDGSKSVKSATTGSWREAYISDTDGNGGDAIVSADFKFTIGGSLIYIALRETGPMLSNRGYYIFHNNSNGNLTISKWEGASAFDLASIGNATALFGGEWYNFRLEASGSNFKLQIQAVTGTFAGQYLNTAGTGWNSSQTYCLTGSNSSFTGAAAAGFAVNQGSANDVRVDNFIFQTPGGAAPTLAISPGTVPNNNSSPIVLYVTRSTSGFVGGSTGFTGSGVTGTSVTGGTVSVIDGTHATVQITTGANTGTFTLTETGTGTAVGTITVGFSSQPGGPLVGPSALVS